MLSLKDFAAVQFSVEIGNKWEIKREILCAPGSDYDMNKNTALFLHNANYRYRKEHWNKAIERKASVILEKLCLEQPLREKIMSVVLSVGRRMLTWAEYHEGTLGFSREYSIDVLNSSFFTAKGIIDNKRVARMLMKDKRLGIKQKYKLACLYFFKEHIPGLHYQMTPNERKEFYHDLNPRRIKQPNVVKFWSYTMMGEAQNLRKEEETLDQYRLDVAIDSGSIAAVECSLEKFNLSIRTDGVAAALETLRKRSHGSEKDWIIFGNTRYNDSKMLWIPSDYYVDILCFLFSRMSEDQLIEVLKEDIKDTNYEIDIMNPMHSRVLEYFLDSPYQCYFMKTAELMWSFLPERSYAYLLLLICDKIEPKYVTVKYGEENSFDYRNLLRVFWSESPDHYKRYVLSDKEKTFVDGRKRTLKEGKVLLVKLFKLKHFTYEDRDNIKVILDSATDEEKENIIYSEEGKSVCFKLMIEQRWRYLDKFVSNIFPTKERAVEFKKKLSFEEKAKQICVDFIVNDQWNAADSFIRWTALPEMEIMRLKMEIVSSESGKAMCRDLFLHTDMETANKICEWSLYSADKIKSYKKELVFCEEGIWICSDLVFKDNIELVNNFINWGHPSEEEIGTLKKNVAYTTGSSVCQKLISNCSQEANFNGEDVMYISVKFNGSKWVQVEKFLTWCFSFEEEIDDFKRNLLTMRGEAEIHMGFLIEMHIELISASKFEEAETLFNWLGLSSKEIGELRKKTIFCTSGMLLVLALLYDDNDLCKDFTYAGGHWEHFELYLRWCLTDVNAVLEFKDAFDEVYGFMKSEDNGEEIYRYDREALNTFNSLIAELLNDLSEESECYLKC